MTMMHFSWFGLFTGTREFQLCMKFQAVANENKLTPADNLCFLNQPLQHSQKKINRRQCANELMMNHACD
jgi:hypothetical protein